MPNKPKENQNEIPISPETLPIYTKCLDCDDYATTCRGFDLVTLGDIRTVRSFHKAVKKKYDLTLNEIAEEAKEIGKHSVEEYFSPIDRDFKWTTVVVIDRALLTLCGHRIGLPPLDHACPISSSEARQQLASADMNLAAANMTIANLQAECNDLRRRMADSDSDHVVQLAELQLVQRNESDWLKNDIKLWRRIAFILLGIGLVVLVALLGYLAYDIAHPGSGLVRY